MYLRIIGSILLHSPNQSFWARLGYLPRGIYPDTHKLEPFAQLKVYSGIDGYSLFAEHIFYRILSSCSLTRIVKFQKVGVDRDVNIIE